MKNLLKPGFGSLIGVGLTILGAELFAALSRDYLSEGPPDRIQGVFGSDASPRLDLLVLGDSLCLGVGTTPERSFPWLVSERLGDEFKVHLKVLAISGNTATDVADSQLPQALDLHPRLVLVHIGANDATHLTPLSRVKQKIGHTLDTLTEAGSAVVVVGPPDMGTPRAWAQPLRSLVGWSGRRVNAAIRDEAVARGIPFFDLAAATGDDFNREPFRYFSWDLFHPSAGGYRLWAEAMFETIRTAAVRTVSEGAERP